MGRFCTVCHHQRRDDVERDILRGLPHLTIARAYGLDHESITRHFEHGHIAKSLVRSAEAREVLRADRLLAEVQARYDRLADDERFAMAILGREVQDDNRAGALRAWRARLDVDSVRQRWLELLARLTGMIQEQQTVNILVLPQWQVIQERIAAALEPYPEAMEAVAAALEGVA